MRSLAHELWEIHDDLRDAAERAAKGSSGLGVKNALLRRAIGIQVRRLRKVVERAGILEDNPIRAPAYTRSTIRRGGRLTKVQLAQRAEANERIKKNEARARRQAKRQERTK
jgi:hypothetical protein